MEIKSHNSYSLNNSSLKKQSFNRFCTPPLKQDSYTVSLKSNKAKNIVSFSGLMDALKPKLEIQILDGVTQKFVDKVSTQINDFPSKFLRELKKANFKVVLSPTLSDAYSSQKVFDANVFKTEFMNPKGTLGATYYEGINGKNFFAFAEKPPFSDKYMEGIVNHELSHGIDGVKELNKNQEVLIAIKKDIAENIKERKLDKLNPIDRKIASKYFFNKDAHAPLSEMISDTLAWKQKGGGCYGSGLIEGESNPNLVSYLFPNLSKKLDEIL